MPLDSDQQTKKGHRSPVTESGSGSTSHQPSELNSAQITDSKSQIHDPARSEVEPSYVLVTPVRNEEKYIEETLKSVISQTILPQEWIIVSDGSTDSTDPIIERYQQDASWIKLIKLPQRDFPSFAAVVENTTLAVTSLETKDYQYLGLLDSDLRFEPDYFEKLISEFMSDPKLGLAGGVAIDIGLPKDVLPRNKQDVPGALQFFRRECFEAIGGLLPIPEGGWDCLSCVMSRMRGWKTKLITHLIVDHLKPRNTIQGGRFRRKFQMGLRDYAIGNHPVFEIAKCSTRVLQQPLLLGSICWLYGYFYAALKRHKRITPIEVVKHLRNEQVQRLTGSNKNL